VHVLMHAWPTVSCMQVCPMLVYATRPQVGEGAMSIRTANTIATTMVSAGFAPHGVQTLAGIGSSGLHPQHLERDLRRKLRGHHGFDFEPYIIRLTLKNSNDLGWVFSS
jgi:hypothetical protein